MRKICLLLVLVLILSGCGLFSNKNKVDDFSKIFDSIEESGNLKASFSEEVVAKMTDQNQKFAFEADFFFISGADITASIYLGAIELYMLLPATSEFNIQKSGDTYIITDADTQVKTKFDLPTNSYYLEVTENGTVTMICEMVKLGKDHFAYQLYLQADGEKAVYQMVLEGKNGRLSVNTEATAIPASIYKSKSIPESFATAGTRVYTFENGIVSFEGTLENPFEDVIDITIVSGLKQEYDLNETFSISEIVIKITYSDLTYEEINLSTAMIVGTIPNTSTAGTKTLTIKCGEIQKSFTFTVIDPSQPQKKATNFEIVSGLKSNYKVGEQFDVTNVKIRVTYEDGSKEDIFVTEAMVVGSVPTTNTTGTKTFTLSYKGHQQSFSFTVTEGEMTTAEKLQKSFDGFYKTLIMNTETGSSFYFSISDVLMNDPKEAEMEFFNSFSAAAFAPWSNVTLLFDGVLVIAAHEEGLLGVLYPDPSENFGKTAYCNYDETSQTYRIGYWKTKGLYTYWFEQEISFDEATDSLRAVTKCGVDSQQLIRGYLEYKKIADGNYAANLYFPADENDDDGKYTSFEFRFTETEGVISQNLWAQAPASVYKSTADLSNYGKQGDKTLTLNNGELTLVDRLKSEAEEFYRSFLGEEFEYETSLEFKYLKRMSELAEEKEYYFDGDSYSLYYSCLNDYLYLLADYQKKVFDFSQYDEVNIIKQEDEIRITTVEGDIQTIYYFHYKTNQLSLLVDYNNGYVLLAELVKEGDKYYVQIAEGYGNEYYIHRAVYHDNNNMNFAYLEINKLIPIFSNDLTGYALTGDIVFALVNGVLSYSEK